MPILERFFGPTRDEIWEQLAEEIGGNFYDGGLWLGDSKVRAHAGDWIVTLDTYRERGTTFTRLRAPFVNKDGFVFSIFREDSFEDRHSDDNQDLEVGQPDFDKTFVIKSNNVEEVKKLFSDEKIRKHLEKQPQVFFSAAKYSGWYSKDFPDGIGELLFQVRGEIKDLARLKELYALFGETLDQLCRIGAATHDDPGLVI
ncbi:MAG TPA: hypothetical protein VHS80_04990 [Chthoniobacterales bacterium]|jgi:hypothetical protein|nr:hypothetical protein [Chthoniobacterales bacterium]